MIDLLQIVEVFQHIQYFLHLGGIVARQFNRVFSTHGHLGHFGLQARGFEGVFHRFKISRWGDHFNRAIVVGDDIVRAVLERDFHDLVFVAAGRKHQLAAMLN